MVSMPSSPGSASSTNTVSEKLISPWPGLSRRDSFFEDDHLSQLIARGCSYFRAGVPLHLSGSAGLGKTTTALRIAEEMERPVVFMAGNQWLEASDFIGREVGKSTRTVVDKYIQSVRRTDGEERVDWRNAILADAMLSGSVLVYDEFTRASQEANSVLLSVLEEGVLIMTNRAAGQTVIQAHQEFRIILTSNPFDYIGVKDAPDALLDRMITLPMPAPSDDTIRGILIERTGLSTELVSYILSIVNKQGQGDGSRLRAALMIARVAAHMGQKMTLDADALGQIASDVLQGRRRALSGLNSVLQKEAS